MRASIFALVIVSRVVTANAESYGSYSQCKALGGGQYDQCMRCIGGGQYFNRDPRTKAWTCGMTGDMHKSKAIKPPPPPPKPKLSKYFSAYATIAAGNAVLGSPEREEGRDSNERKSTVKVTKAFLVKTTEVTHNEWYNVMGSPHWSYDAACGMDCPVGSIRWVETLSYLNELSKREKLEACYDLSAEIPTFKGIACKGYRLPTEAEWVLAARGGTNDARYGELDAIAWHNGNSDGKPHRVAGKKANAFGLYDMLGNVSEWTWDIYEFLTSDEGTADPVHSKHPEKELAIENDRTVCGGNYSVIGGRSRAAAREGQPGNSRAKEIGFRPVRTK